MIGTPASLGPSGAHLCPWFQFRRARSGRCLWAKAESDYGNVTFFLFKEHGLGPHDDPAWTLTMNGAKLARLLLSTDGEAMCGYFGTMAVTVVRLDRGGWDEDAEGLVPLYQAYLSPLPYEYYLSREQHWALEAHSGENHDDPVVRDTTGAGAVSLAG